MNTKNANFQDFDSLPADLRALLLLGISATGQRAGPRKPGEIRKLIHSHGWEMLSRLGNTETEGFPEEIPDPDGSLQRILHRTPAFRSWYQRMQDLGIQPLCPGMEHYPLRLVRKMGQDAPLLVFAAGNLELLKSPATGAVGARKTTLKESAWCRHLGASTRILGEVLVSGNARGSDRTSMEGCLETGGSSIAVLPHALEKAVGESENRQYLQEGRLLLLIPFAPHLPFSGFHAKARNRLIFALSDRTLVAAAGANLNRGGTRAGVLEQVGGSGWNYSPVYVRNTGENAPGLKDLIRRGALPLDAEPTPDVLNALRRDPRNGIPE